MFNLIKRSWPVPNQPARILLKQAIIQLAPAGHGRVLDIGASSYLRYKHLFKNATTYTTLDIAGTPDLIGSITAIPAPDAQFDSIVCTQVIGDVFELHRAFAEMHRVLVDSGTALISENLFYPLHDEPHDFWRFTPYSLRALAERAGFTVLDILPFGGYRATARQLFISSKWSFLARFLPMPGNQNDNTPLGFVMIIRK